MTAATRERGLRRRLDVVTADRDRARASMSAVWRRYKIGAPTRCVYCGAPAWSLACASHHDLVGLDPYYNQPCVVVEAVA